MLQTVFKPERIDWESPGKRTYQLAMHLDGKWGHLLLPVTVIVGEAGPGNNGAQGVACFGGNHGDEYEGQVALRRLGHDLDPTPMRGRVILVPQLNPPACQQRLRESPLDGVNMNRAFPGDSDGTITFRIADFVTQHIFPHVDVVLDHHAGGAELGFAMACSYLPPEDPLLEERIQHVASLYDTPFILKYSREIHGGLLVEEADRQGKIAIGGEFGYGAGTSRVGVQHVYEGVCNILRDFQMLPGPVAKVDTSRPDPPRVVEAVGVESYVPAPFTGVFEPVVDLGDRVEHGQLLGRFYDFERPESLPLEIEAPHGGYLICHRFQSPVDRGDTLFVVASESNPPTSVHR